MKKLSPAQQSLLNDAVERGLVFCDPKYPPFRILIEQGLLTGVEGKFGSYRGIPTAAGIALIRGASVSKTERGVVE